MSHVQVGEARNSTVSIFAPFQTSVTRAFAYRLPMSGELTDSTLAMTIKSQFATRLLNWTDATFANDCDAVRRMAKVMRSDVRIGGLTTQRPGPRDAWIVTATLTPALQRMLGDVIVISQ